MNITLDARMYGIKHAGIGRYTQNLISHLLDINPPHHFHLLLHPENRRQYRPSARLSLSFTTIRHYSLAEQIYLPSLISATQPDLVHIPHFNVPIFLRTPFVVTIHDILWHQVKGPQVTTLSPVKYYLKYLGYRAVVNHAVKRAQAVITPSLWVKQALLNAYPGLEYRRVHPVYEGVDTGIAPSTRPPSLSLDKPYIIYVGSAYPHKNLPLLFDVLTSYRHRYNTDLHLVIVSARSVFLDKIKTEIGRRRVAPSVTILNSVTDSQLAYLLQRSICLVHPSLSEGFGLTGLEAMQLNTPVISSTAGALPEIYSNGCLYLNPTQPDTIAGQIRRLQTDTTFRHRQISLGKKQAKKYSWTITARQTLDIYNSVLNQN